MSTRGAFGIRSDKKLFVTYKHGDSYPEVFGEEMINFFKNLNTDDIKKLKNKFRNIIVVQEDDIPSEKEIAEYKNKGYKEDYNDLTSQPIHWFYLLRRIQGVEFFRKILDNELRHWIDYTSFLKNSLHCEYAYIFDLDTREIEFYEGFNKEPDKNSPLPFLQVYNEKTYNHTQSKYYPVRFKGKKFIDKIEKDWIPEFYS